MNNLIFLIIYIVEGIIFLQYCTNLLEAKISKRSNLIHLSAVYFVLFLLSLFKLPFLNMSGFLLLNVLYMKLSYNINLLSSLFHATVASVIMNFGELITLNLFPANNLGFYDGTYSFFNLLTLSLFSKFFYFFLTKLVILISTKKDKTAQTTKKELLLLSSIPLFSFLIYSAIIFVITTTAIPTIVNIFLSFGSILLLVLNFVIYYIYHYISQKNKDYLTLELQLQHDRDLTIYYQKLQEQDESQKILIHDFNKHVHTLQSLYSEGEYSAANEYVKKLAHSEALKPSLRISNHNLFNAILYRYTIFGEKNKVSFACDIRKNSIHFLENEDLTSLFCNLLDNAFESAIKSENSFVELSTKIKNNTHCTVVTVQNTCNIDPFSKDSRKLVSKKSDSAKHGFGLKSINRIVEKYDGILKAYYDNETSTFHTIILFHHHT